MSSLSPPLLYAGIGNKIAQRPLDLAPCRCREYAVAMGEIHCFEVVEETVEERTEPEFRDRIEIGERLYASKKNCAELGAIVQSACQIAPLHRENRYVRAFKAFDDCSIDEAQFPLEINAFKPPKSHDEPEVHPHPFHFGESLRSGIGLQHQWDHVFVFHCSLRGRA